MRKGGIPNQDDAALVRERPSRSELRNGIEYPDPTPVQIPTRLSLPSSHSARLRELVRQELSMQAEASGMESFEEADDFELPDEEWSSPYEDEFEPPLVAAEGSGVSKSQHSSLAKQGSSADDAGHGASKETEGGVPAAGKQSAAPS